MIPSEEEEHALNRNLPKDWITIMELSDAVKEIILDPELPSTLKMVLYNCLIYQRLNSIKEYDETLFAAASLSDAKKSTIKVYINIYIFKKTIKI